MEIAYSRKYVESLSKDEFLSFIREIFNNKDKYCLLAEDGCAIIEIDDVVQVLDDKYTNIHYFWIDCQAGVIRVDKQIGSSILFQRRMFGDDDEFRLDIYKY